MSAARQLAVQLRAALVRHPALPLALVALATFVWFGASNGGFDGTTWYPGSLIVLALFVIAALTLPAGEVPGPVKVAVVALILYAAWSYLSIAWAAQKADAWDGANRTLLYALTFALFAIWRPRGRTAVALLIVFCVGVATVGLVELLRAANASDARAFFSEGRFASPAGYMNANVALWFSALWPCVILAARRELHPVLRGLLAGSAVLLCGLAVLGQSRGWLFTAPIAGLLIIAFVPRRVRTVLTLAFVLGVTGIVTSTLLDVYRAAGERGFDSAVSDAARALVVAALLGGLAFGLLGGLEQRLPRPSRARERQSGRGLAAIAVVIAVAGLVVFVSVKGSPFTVISRGWHEFKTQPSPYGGASRFTGSLGTHRYDFWRVAWDRFRASPVGGDGTDNFQQAYLAVRKSPDAPRYPHSVELRALSETGLVGTVLLAVAFGAAIWAALRAMRLRRGLGAAAAAAGLAACVYWIVHGTIDWFWEFPALGAAAFALLGLSASLLPRPATAPRPVLRLGRTAALLALPAIAAAISFVLPWLSELDQNKAVGAWRTDSAAAFRSLDRASSLNPLSAMPKLLAGSIALRVGQTEKSMLYFRQAIERDAGDSYAHLELGALLFRAGSRAEAVATLAEAHRLDPRDDLTAAVYRRARSGKPIDIAAVNRQLAARSAKLGR